MFMLADEIRFIDMVFRKFACPVSFLTFANHADILKPITMMNGRKSQTAKSIVLLQK